MTEQKLGNIKNFAGAIFSLDQRKASILGIGDKQPKVWFTAKAWCLVIPEGLTDTEAMQLQGAINTGTLVPGKVYIPAKQKDDNTIPKYLALLRRTLTPPNKAPFIDLVHKKSEGNYSAKEILSACIADEQKVRNRADWITFLKAGLSAYEGPDYVVEDREDDPEAYVVTIDPTTKVIQSDSRPADKRKGKGKGKDISEIETPLTAAQKNKAIDDFLGA